MTPFFAISWLFLLALAYLLFSRSPKKPPSYHGKAVFGFLTIATDFLADPIRVINEGTKERGDVFSLPMLTLNNVWLRGNTLHRFYLDSREDVWSFADGMRLFFDRLVEEGYWKHYKVLLSSISRYVNRSAAQSYAARVTISETQNKAAAWAASGEEIRLFDALSGLVNGSIVRSLMGEDFYTNHAEELLQLIHTMEENVGNPWNFLLPTKWVPHAAGRRLDRARIRMNEIYSERLRAREALPGDHKTDFDDFFAFTLQDKTTAPLQHFMSGHNTLLIFAAHTSTVAVIAWVIIDLLRRPEMMQRVLQEVRAPGAAEYPLLQACIKETSRVYIGFKMLRRAQKDVKIPGSEYVIPKGSLVSISPYLAHHDPENFPRPDEWIPERWLDSPTGEGSSELGSAKSVGGAGFMPFGSGCHRCPGEKLATVMVFRALVTLLGSWDVEWADEGVPSRTDFENFNFDKVGSAWLRGDVGVRFKSA